MRKLFFILFFCFVNFALFAQSNSNDLKVIIDSMVDIMGKSIPNDAIGGIEDNLFMKEAPLFKDKDIEIYRKLQAFYVYETKDDSTIKLIAYIVQYDEGDVVRMSKFLLSSIIRKHLKELDGINSIVSGYMYRGFYLRIFPMRSTDAVGLFIFFSDSDIAKYEQNMN